MVSDDLAPAWMNIDRWRQERWTFADLVSGRSVSVDSAIFLRKVAIQFNVDYPRPRLR